jgi:hypothetical protein
MCRYASLRRHERGPFRKDTYETDRRARSSARQRYPDNSSEEEYEEDIGDIGDIGSSPDDHQSVDSGSVKKDKYGENEEREEEREREMGVYRVHESVPRNPPQPSYPSYPSYDQTEPQPPSAQLHIDTPLLTRIPHTPIAAPIQTIPTASTKANALSIGGIGGIAKQPEATVSQKSEGAVEDIGGIGKYTLYTL